MLSSVLQRVRAAPVSAVHPWKVLVDGIDEPLSSVIMGGSLSGPRIRERPNYGIYQEGFSLLVGAKQERRARVESDVVVPPEVIGMRIWVTEPSGVHAYMQGKMSAFAVAGFDIVGTKYLMGPVYVVTDPTGTTGTDLVGLAQFGKIEGPIVMPWVADAIPTFAYDWAK